MKLRVGLKVDGHNDGWAEVIVAFDSDEEFMRISDKERARYIAKKLEPFIETLVHMNINHGAITF